LKFNRSFEKCTGVFIGEGGRAMPSNGSWQVLAPRNDAIHSTLVARFFGKFVLDILPAALASVIGGFLFTQYQLGRAAPPAVQQMSPASAEVLALVHDEHEAIIGYLKAQTSAEKSRLAAEDADTARAVAEAKAAQEDEARKKAAAEQSAAEIKLAVMTPAVMASPATASPAMAPPATVPARRPSPATAAKVTLPRPKPANAPTPPPLQLAGDQAEQAPQAAASVPAEGLARDPDSLLAKTLELKDHVVAATKQAVAAIGDMFASVGERIGGSAPTARPFSSDS
jgi:hypothetical protein